MNTNKNQDTSKAVISRIYRNYICLSNLILLLILSSGCNSFYDVLMATPAPQTSFLPSQPK
ncbi:MAG: hypothetical protein NT118_05385, partial [Lentisphaerae bacterium]|nr:hypothetical protein [Lentisphaerota bacterium]